MPVALSLNISYTNFIKKSLIKNRKILMQLLRAKQVAAKRGRSITQLYVDIADKKFPQGIKLSPKIVVWDESVVDQHIENELKQAGTA